MEMIGRIAIEVIAGVIATAILAIGSWLAAGLARPGRISGKWKSDFVLDGTAHIESIRSRQFPFGIVLAHSELSWIDRDNGTREKPMIRNYGIFGLFHNDILTALYWCKDKRVSDRGAFVMKYKEVKGNRLKGKYMGLEGDEQPHVEHVEIYDWDQN